MSTTPPAEYQTNQPMTPENEKLWATLVHIGGIFFGFLPALIGYLVLKDRGPFIREHTAAALNFQISMVIYTVGVTIVSMVLTVVIIGAFIAPIAYTAIGVLILVFSIIAAMKANKGEYYTYPLSIKFVS